MLNTGYLTQGAAAHLPNAFASGRQIATTLASDVGFWFYVDQDSP